MGTKRLAERNPEMEADARWHLDKRIPIAIILAIVIQTAGALLWVGSITERVSTAEKRIDAAAPNADRLTRVEVKVEAVQEGVTEIKRLLQARGKGS